MGDVKLAALIGLVLGSLGLGYVGVAAGAAIVFGAVGAIVALAYRAEPQERDPVRTVPGARRRGRRLLGSADRRLVHRHLPVLTLPPQGFKPPFLGRELPP